MVGILNSQGETVVILAILKTMPDPQIMIFALLVSVSFFLQLLWIPVHLQQQK